MRWIEQAAANEFVRIFLMDLDRDNKQPGPAASPVEPLPEGGSSQSASSHREMIRAVFHHTVIVVIVHWRHAAPEIEKPLAA